jgi:hypothetical protein
MPGLSHDSSLLFPHPPVGGGGAVPVRHGRTSARTGAGRHPDRGHNHGVADGPGGQLKGSWFKRVGLGRIVTGAGFGTTFDAKPGQPYNFTLGGPFNQGALVPGTLVGPNYLQATGGYLYEIGRLPSLLGGPVLAGGWLETGGVYDEWDDKTWSNNISGGVIVESILGPLFGGVSIDLDGGWRYYISIGRLFR